MSLLATLWQKSCLLTFVIHKLWTFPIYLCLLLVCVLSSSILSYQINVQYFQCIKLYTSTPGFPITFKPITFILFPLSIHPSHNFLYFWKYWKPLSMTLFSSLILIDCQSPVSQPLPPLTCFYNLSTFSLFINYTNLFKNTITLHP